MPLSGYKTLYSSDIGRVDTSDLERVGTRAVDNAGNEYVYLQGTASVVIRDWVVYDENFNTTRLTANEVGPVAVAPTAIVLAQYGWFQVYGVVQGNTDTIAADSSLYIDGTAGRVDDLGVSGDLVIGAYSMTASVANVATCYITYPHVSNDIGGTAGVTPGGADTQVQFNDAGAFQGDAGFTYEATSNTVTATAFVSDRSRTASAVVTSSLSVDGGSGSAIVRATRLTADRNFDLPDTTGTAVVSIEAITASAILVNSSGSWRVRTPAQVRGDLGLIIGTNVQAWDDDLDDLGALTHAASSIIVSDGTNWLRKSATQARGDLGLVIGTDVQAFDAQLADVAALSPTASSFIVGDGANFVLRSAANARIDLGLGSSSSPQFSRIGVGTAAAATARLEVYGNIVSELWVNTSAATAQTVSWASASVHTINLNPGGTTYITWATGTLVSGAVMVISCRQPTTAGPWGTGIVWPSTVEWPAGTAPALTATTSVVDVFSFFRHGPDNVEYAQTVGQDYRI